MRISLQFSGECVEFPRFETNIIVHDMSEGKHSDAGTLGVASTEILQRRLGSPKLYCDGSSCQPTKPFKVKVSSQMEGQAFRHSADACYHNDVYLLKLFLVPEKMSSNVCTIFFLITFQSVLNYECKRVCLYKLQKFLSILYAFSDYEQVYKTFKNIYFKRHTVILVLRSRATNESITCRRTIHK